MNTLVDMISGMEVKEDDENYKNAVDYMFDGLAKRKPDCFAVKQYRKFKLSSGKTAKASSFPAAHVWLPLTFPSFGRSCPMMSWSLTAWEIAGRLLFSASATRTAPTISLWRWPFRRCSTSCVNGRTMLTAAGCPIMCGCCGTRRPTPQVPNLEKLVAVIRSREISLCLLYQQLAQCKAIYDKNAETILGNMDSVLFLGGREASTIKEISENWLGKATISMQTEGRSRGQSESYSQNTQRLGRELMTPSELATMPGDRCILQLRGLPPFYSKKYDLKQHPNYKYTAEADKVKNAFDLNGLVTRRMDKLNPNETYTVYKVDVPDEALTDEDEDILNYDDLDDPDAFV